VVGFGLFLLFALNGALKQVGFALFLLFALNGALKRVGCGLFLLFALNGALKRVSCGLFLLFALNGALKRGQLEQKPPPAQSCRRFLIYRKRKTATRLQKSVSFLPKFAFA